MPVIVTDPLLVRVAVLLAASVREGDADVVGERVIVPDSVTDSVVVTVSVADSEEVGEKVREEVRVMEPGGVGEWEGLGDADWAR